jgi:hypothetical protein
MIYTLSVTFFAFDWIMSLAPEWYSSTFGFLIGSGQLLAGLAFVILIQCGLAPEGEDSRARLHDLGNLLLGAVLFWTYIAFMEYLIIWSGDLPHGISWSVQRGGGWSVLAMFVIALHFAVPFIVLLSRRGKRSRRILALTAAMLLLGHLLDVFWLVLPAFAQHPAALLLPLLAVLLTLAIGALWLALFSWQLQAALTDTDARTPPLVISNG